MLSFSASASLSSFSLLRKSSLSSLSSPTTVGVCGLESKSPFNPSITGFTGVMLRAGDGEVDVAMGLFAWVEGALSGVAQSPGSTAPPDRQIASSASSASIYFWYLALAAVAFPSRPLSSSGDSSALTRAEFLMDLARIPKRRVESVSASL
jgi:hypothetical protein